MSDDSSAVAQDTDVEQYSEPVPPKPGPVQPHADVAALTAELAKWQARVPKLASALKERSTQVTVLEQRLAQLQSSAERKPTSDHSAGVRARDQLIVELETKQRQLTERNRQLETELHSGKLELEEHKVDLATWREKWQSMAAALDDQASEAAAVLEQRDVARAETAAALEQRDASRVEIERLMTELGERSRSLESKITDNAELIAQLQSLDSRNANLLETTELANTQIEALGESLVNLKQRLRDREQALTELGVAHDEQTRVNAERQRQLEALQVELDAVVAQREQQRSEHADRQAISEEEIRRLKELVRSQVQQFEALDQDHHRFASEAKQTEQALKEELDRSVEARLAVIAEHQSTLAVQASEHEQQREALRSQMHLQDLDRRTEQATLLLGQEHWFAQALRDQEQWAGEQLQQLQNSNLELSAELAQSHSLGERQAADIRHLEEELQALAEGLHCAQNDALQQQSARMDAEAEAEQLRVQLTSALADIAAANDETLMAIAAAESAHAQAEATAATLAQANLEIDQLAKVSAEQTAALDAMAASAEQQLAELEASARGAIDRQEAMEEAHRQQLAATQADLERIRSELVTANENYAVARSELEQQQAQAQEQFAKANAEHQALNAQLGERSTENAALLAQLEESNRRAMDRQQAMEEAHRQQLAAAQADAEHVRSELVTANENYAVARSELEQQQSQAQEQLARANAEHQALSAQLTDLNQGHRKALEALEATHQAELTTLAQELVTTRREAAAVERASTERLRILELEHADILGALSRAELVVQEQTSQRDQLTSRVRDLEAKLGYTKEMEEELSTLRSQAVAAAKRLEQAQEQLQQVDNLERALTASESNQRNLQSQYDDLLEQQVQLRSELAARPAPQDGELQERVTIAALEAQLVELQEVTNERDSYIATVINLEDELQALKQQNRKEHGALSGSPMASAATDSDVRRLEELVRERTEEANRLRWQLNMKEESERKSSDSTTAGPPPVGSDKMLLVLNQQLQNLQQENQRLSTEVRRLSKSAPTPPVAAQLPVDDLTKIRGVGDKLVEQLAKAGVRSFAQIALLQPQELEQEEHPLHAYRARIIRDQWISQAAALMS